MAIARGISFEQLETKIRSMNLPKSSFIIAVYHGEYWAAYDVYNPEAYIKQLEMEHKQWKIIKLCE
jgi:hypothetical protein